MRFKYFIEAFYGVKDIQNELHQKLQPVYKSMGIGGHSYYVIVDDKTKYDDDGHIDGKVKTAEIFSPSFPGDKLKKIIQAVEYFLQEMGVKFKKPYRSPHDEDMIVMEIEDYPQYDKSGFDDIKNTTMKQKLMSGQSIDVNDIGYEVEPDVYKLNKFMDDVDYVVVDPSTKEVQFIASIGKDKSTDEIFASTDGRFYNDPNYETLWLR